MIPRYNRPKIEKIWSDYNKYSLWLKIEIAAATWDKLELIMRFKN